MSALIIAIVVFALVVVIWFIGESNRLNRYQVMIEESKRTVDITLVKRYDTISEMLKAAKAYAKHEEKVFTELVSLRQGASIQESNQVIANQNDVLAQIRAVGENYPELLSSNQFLALQKEIADENEDLALPENRGQVSNAFQHIWGYFKKQATAEEKADFMLLLEKYQHGQAQQEDLIKGIQTLLERYPNRYLQDSTLLGGQ